MNNQGRAFLASLAMLTLGLVLSLPAGRSLASQPARPFIPPAWVWFLEPQIKSQGQGPFAYTVRFEPLVDIAGLRIYFSHSEKLELEGEPQAFAGDLKAGQVLEFKLSGRTLGPIDVGEGRTIAPVLRLHVEALYPLEAVRKMIIKQFREHGPRQRFTLEQTLAELECRRGQPLAVMPRTWSP